MCYIAVNGALGFIMLVTFRFTLGDLNSILQTPTGSPLLQVFFTTTKSYAGSNTMTAITIITLIASAISTIVTCSRQFWAFARDRGLPFLHLGTRILPLYSLTSLSANIMQVYHSWDIPLNAIFMSFSLINLGSTFAIQAVSSLSASLLPTSYMVSTSTLLLRRATGLIFPRAAGPLASWERQSTLSPCASSVFSVFSRFPPPAAVVTATTVNWTLSCLSSLLSGGVLLFSQGEARAHRAGNVGET
jgi:amino acid transporter